MCRHGAMVAQDICNVKAGGSSPSAGSTQDETCDNNGLDNFYPLWECYLWIVV